MFNDRDDAARQLADRLAYLKGERALVLAIPRGAVPMGRVIADRLGADLDVVLVRKLRSSFNREFAIGAIDESGAFELSADAAYAGGNLKNIALVAAFHAAAEGRTIELAHLARAAWREHQKLGRSWDEAALHDPERTA